MLVAVGVFLIAHSDGAEDRKLAHLQPEVGDGGQRPCVAFRRIDLVVDVDLVDEVVFAGPVIHLVHPALDAEPGAAHVHGVGETGVEATLIGCLVRARGGGEGDGIDLRAAADLDPEVLFGRLLGEPLVPLTLEIEVAADFVGFVGLLFFFLLFLLAVLGLGQRLNRGHSLLFKLLETRFQFGDATLLGAERVGHLLERLQPRGDAGKVERLLGIYLLRNHQKGICGIGGLENGSDGTNKQAEAGQQAAPGTNQAWAGCPLPSC